MTYDKVYEKILYLRTLKDGWDTYDTPGPNDVAEENALRWLYNFFCDAIEIGFVCPLGGSPGGIGFELIDDYKDKKTQKYVAFLFRNDGIIEFDYYDEYSDWMFLRLLNNEWKDVSNEA